MNSLEQPIQLAGRALTQHRHICSFFHTADEEYEVLLPFIADGFRQGDRAFHIVDPKLHAEHLTRLAAAGIDTAAALSSGQLEVRPWDDAYLRQDCFDQYKMIALLTEEALEAGRRQGYSMTRLVAHMEWALEQKPGVEDLLEYETRLNYVLPKYIDPVICTYDLARFGGGIVVDIMRTHPAVIIGGILQENPFFVPPDQFLQELRGRRPAGPAPGGVRTS